MILDFCKEAKSVLEIMEQFGFNSRTSFRRKYLDVLVKDGRLKMTLPDKPRSKNQKYYSQPHHNHSGHDVVMMKVDVKEVEIYCYKICIHMAYDIVKLRNNENDEQT